MISRLTSPIVCSFSVRLKGPKSFRDKVKNNALTQKKQIKEDFFKGYYVDTHHLYKNNFTQSELKNTNEMVRRVFSLENATPKEILKYRISQAVKKYQTSLLDHGSAAIQCASMSEKIILMMQHIKKYPKDTTAARSLVELIQKRRNMLDYLMRTDFHRYKWICVDYGIPETTSKTAHHKTDFILFINPSRGL